MTDKRGRAVWAWLVGLGALAGVLAVGFHLAEARDIWEAFRRANPVWLALGLALQALTYFAQGQIFREVARAGASFLSASTAYRISVTKLFVDQALPSAGLSGTAVAAQQLRRAGMSRPLVAASVVISIASYELAYAFSLLAALPVVAARGSVHGLLAWAVVGFSIAAVIWSVIVIWLAGRRSPPRLLARVGPVRELLGFLSAADPQLTRSRRLLTLASGWQLAIVAADAATLWVLLRGLDESISPIRVFASFMLANAFRTIALVPGGLGTFEGAAVISLHSLGVSIAVALTATLLFRALSFWLPMPLGFYWYQRVGREALRAARQRNAAPESVAHSSKDAWDTRHLL